VHDKPTVEKIDAQRFRDSPVAPEQQNPTFFSLRREAPVC
jgi:hypothetical protein